MNRPDVKPRGQGPRLTLADRYLIRTRRRLAASYGLLLAITLIGIVAATYTSVHIHESTQIRDQLINAARDKLHTPDITKVLHQSPQMKDEEEAVRTFIISRDGVLRDADAVTHHPPDPASVGRVLRGAPATVSRVRGPVGDLSAYTVPIVRRGKVVGVIQTVTADSPYNAVLQYLLVVSLAAGGTGMLLAAAFGIIMAGWALRPIRSAISSQQAFAQNAAHELRTPLTLMRTAAELALGSDDPDELRDALTTTVRQTEHLDAVVRDLRLLSQGDTARLVVDLSAVDLAVLALDVYDEIRPVAEARGIELRLDTPRTLNLVADQQRLRQLLMILIDNALRYTPAGGHINVAVRRHERKVILTVQDAGSGIEPRHLPHIFERFYRGDAARTQHPGGTGLGLAIAREIVEAHGGKIAVQSRPGAGTAFRIAIPTDHGMTSEAVAFE